ncbi:MAG TPA: hypothetical protein VNN72_07515 [Polyangiaceae bacterium]|nr:hypothetical protein [Polyangiaceae bacterium]
MATHFRSVPSLALPPIPWSHTATVVLTGANLVLGLVAFYAFPLLPLVALLLVAVTGGAFGLSRARAVARRREAETRFVHGPTMLPSARGLA